MPKRKLTALAEEYGISFEDAQDLAFEKFDEDMITGRGKNTWIDQRGVLSEAPNPSYVICYIKELTAKVPVRIPLRYKGMLNNKIIHIQADNTGNAPKYNWIPTKIRT